MRTLDELRTKIDVIDDGITDLFNERMKLVREIGEVKAACGTAVAEYNREKSVIHRVTARVDDDKKVFAKQVFEKLFEVSKAYQTNCTETVSPLCKEISLAVANTGEDFPVSATVACQGIAGAYSMLACERLFSISDILYFKDWNGVFGAIEMAKGVKDVDRKTETNLRQVRLDEQNT